MGGGVIRTKGLTKHYGDKTHALHKVNLSINEGEWTSIMGPSGSGKTTLLNMIGCLDKPTSGSVVIWGVDVTSLDQKQLTRFRRENIGLIFQQYHLIPYLTALENVMMAQYFCGVTDEGRARELLGQVGMGHRLDHVPAHLSGGEQQRVCIARALVNEPDILLADEPTGNLDQESGRVVLELMKKLQKKGHTILVITHNREIGKLGDRLIELVDGKVVDGSSGSGKRSASKKRNRR